jgi:urease accessory protein
MSCSSAEKRGRGSRVSLSPGALRLVFSIARDGRTFLESQYASYPFHICRAQHLDADPTGLATLYLQSCAGGIYEGDELLMEITASEGAALHLTTQASTIVHRCDGLPAKQTAWIAAKAGTLVEYLPDPAILFSGARFHSTLTVRAHETARLLLSDAFLSHDPTGGDRPFGWLRSEIRIEDEAGRLLALDRFRVDGGTIAAGEVGVAGRHRVHGVVMAIDRVGDKAGLMTILRGVLAETPGVFWGVSSLPNDCGAWLRLLAEDGASLRRAMTMAWMACRKFMTGVAPAPRRK